MKVELNLEKGYCKVTKEKGDPRFTRGNWGDAESTFLYRALQELKKQGHDVIKKRMWKDGHMVSDSQQYIRTRKYMSTSEDTPGEFAIWSNVYALVDLGEEFNKLKEGESLPENDLTVIT